MNNIIDLSHPLNNQTPVVPGDPKVSISPFLEINKDGCNVQNLIIGTHVGTHIDAPLHMIQNGKSLTDFSVEKFTGNGVCIAVKEAFSLDEIKRISISEDDIILLHTGWDVRYKEEDYFTKHPVILKDIAQYLVEKKIKMVGIDTPSPDHEPYEIHKILLSNDILILENLTNLEELVGKQFTIFAFPLKLATDGSPTRVIAEIQ